MDIGELGISELEHPELGASRMWVVSLPGGDPYCRCPFDEIGLLKRLDVSLWSADFRSVAIGRLPMVLQNGVDVVPSDAPIYVACLGKAWEYGGWPKVTMAFDRNHLQKTYVELDLSAADSEIELVRERYPNVHVRDDGKKLWLTRLPERSRAATTPYEWQYARWIEDDAKEALRAIILFVRPEDAPKVAEVFQTFGKNT